MTNRDSITLPDASPQRDAQDAAGEAHTRADNARRRAATARHAAEQAVTEYARHTHHRVADLYTQLAQSHEDSAQRLPFGGADGDGA
jgi:hypothetical protein